MSQLVRKHIKSLRRGPNARQILGPEDEARALWRSYKKQPIHPFVISLPDLVRDGARRHWGAELEGDLDAEVDCLVVAADLTPAQITALQLVSAVHRSDLSAYDKAVAVREIEAANPVMTRKQIAEDVLDIDPGMVTKLLSLFDCVPEVIEAAKDGKLGAGDWYAVSRSPDQLATLALKLNGASRDEVEAESRKRRNGSATAVRASKIKCALPSGVQVVVSGNEMTLDEMIEAMGEAIKEAKKAREQGLDARTFSAVMRDRAKAG